MNSISDARISEAGEFKAAPRSGADLNSISDARISEADSESNDSESNDSESPEGILGTNVIDRVFMFCFLSITGTIISKSILCK